MEKRRESSIVTHTARPGSVHGENVVGRAVRIGNSLDCLGYVGSLPRRSNLCRRNLKNPSYSREL